MVLHWWGDKTEEGVWALSPKDGAQFEQTTQTRGKAMVWAGISLKGASNLIPIRGTLNAQRYQDEILSCAFNDEMLALLKSGALTFQQDNALPHKARTTMAWLRESGWSHLSIPRWPAKSPAWSAIEFFWQVMTSWIARFIRPRTVAAMENAILLAWEHCCTPHNIASCFARAKHNMMCSYAELGDNKTVRQAVSKRRW